MAHTWVAPVSSIPKGNCRNSQCPSGVTKVACWKSWPLVSASTPARSILEKYLARVADVVSLLGCSWAWYQNQFSSLVGSNPQICSTCHLFSSQDSCVQHYLHLDLQGFPVFIRNRECFCSKRSLVFRYGGRWGRSFAAVQKHPDTVELGY